MSLLFYLMDRVEGGVEPILEHLEKHIVATGLADMKAHADIITTVSSLCLLVLVRAIWRCKLGVN